MTLDSVVLTLALLACAATLSIGGQLIKHSPRRTPFCRGAFFLSIVIGALAIMRPVTARSGSPALMLVAPTGGAAAEPPSGRNRPPPGVEQRIPPGQSMPGEMGQNDDHRRDTALSRVSATGHPKWSLIVERAERLRSQGDYAHAADAYAEVLVAAGGHLEARLGLAQALLGFGRYKEVELHVGRASAIARQGAGSPSRLALALSAVAEVREEFVSRLSSPLTAVQRQRLNTSEQARLTAIHRASPWLITNNVTDVLEELGEFIVEGTLTTDQNFRAYRGPLPHPAEHRRTAYDDNRLDPLAIGTRAV